MLPKNETKNILCEYSNETVECEYIQVPVSGESDVVGYKMTNRNCNNMACTNPDCNMFDEKHIYYTRSL